MYDVVDNSVIMHANIKFTLQYGSEAVLFSKVKVGVKNLLMLNSQIALFDKV